jgi:proline iminopeptidase
MKNLFISLSLIVSTDIIGQSSYYVTSLDKTKLYVQEFGVGQPLIVLAGGPGLDAVYMKAIWENLSNKYRCIVLDQRGTGKSKLESIDSAKVGLSNYVNDIEALRKYLKLDQLTLMGHSWGGMLSMEYAARHPKQVKKLILLGPGGPTGKFFRYYGDNLMMRLQDEDIKEMTQLDSLKKSGLKGYWPGYFYDRKRALDTKSVTDFERLHEHPEIIEFVFAGYISLDDERTKRLKNFKGIVCIIQGRQDPVGESTVYEIKELLPQSQRHFIEKCGHMPWLENPEQVKNFLICLLLV